MTRPHERLGLPQPLGRRLPHGLAAWNALILGCIAACCLGYVIQVNRASGRGFELRETEKRIENLKIEVRALEDSVATLSSVEALTQRAAALGFVPVDRLEFVNPASKSYALK